MLVSGVGAFWPARIGLASLAFLSMHALALAQQATPSPPQPGQLAKPDQNTITSLPNTVSAPPFTVGDKFDYRVVQSFGLRGLGGGLIGAAIGQARNAPEEWGQGVQGFAKRWGSGVAGNLSRQTFAFVLESALHEDPRYFPSEDKSKKRRMLNAVKQTFICKTDSGHSSFAYGRVISQFAGGQFTNVWQPASTGSVSDGFVRAVIGLGGDAAYNFMQEFIPFTRPHSLRHRH
jgi:hypothetical protein